jgi:hypothetical protein
MVASVEENERIDFNYLARCLGTTPESIRVIVTRIKHDSRLKAKAEHPAIPTTETPSETLPND